MAEATINLRSTYGVDNASPFVRFLDENNILYPSGNRVVIYNKESRTQQYLSPTETPNLLSTGISTVALTRNKRYLAMGERSTSGPFVSIYDTTTLRHKRILPIKFAKKTKSNVAGEGKQEPATSGVDTSNKPGTGAEPLQIKLNPIREDGNPASEGSTVTEFQYGSEGKREMEEFDRLDREVFSLSFSTDGKILLCLCEEKVNTDFQLLCWAWEKGKIVSSLKLSLDTLFNIAPAMTPALSPGLSSSSLNTHRKSFLGASSTSFAASSSSTSSSFLSPPSPTGSAACSSSLSSSSLMHHGSQRSPSRNTSRRGTNTGLGAFSSSSTGSSLSRLSLSVDFGPSDIQKTINEGFQGRLIAEYNPNDNNLVLIRGPGIFRIVHLTGSNMELTKAVVPKVHPSFLWQLSSHCWLGDGRLLLGSRSGDMLLFESAEFKQSLGALQIGGETRPVLLLVAFSKGFLCGSTEGRIAIYERSRDLREGYKKAKVKEIDTPGKSSSLVCAVFSEAEENLLVLTKDGQLVLSPFDPLGLEKDDPFSPLGCSFHRSEISSLSLGMQRPLLASGGQDKQLKLWNYAEGRIEMETELEGCVRSLSVHPQGFHVLVAFEGGVALFSLLNDEVRETRRFPVARASAVQFSHGGQSFAICQTHGIHIYSTYLMEEELTLCGHHDAVKGICYSKNDQYLASYGNKGTVLCWEKKSARGSSGGTARSTTDEILSEGGGGGGGAGRGEGAGSLLSAGYRERGVTFTCIKMLQTKQNMFIFVSATDGSVRQIDAYSSNLVYRLKTHSSLTCLSIVKDEFLVIGTARTQNSPHGKVLCYSLPFLPTSPEDPQKEGRENSHTAQSAPSTVAQPPLPLFTETVASFCSVRALGTDYYSENILVGTSSGTIAHYGATFVGSEQNENEEDPAATSSTVPSAAFASGAKRKAKESLIVYSDEVLFTRTDLERKYEYIEQLRRKVANLERQKDQEMEDKDKELKMSIQKLTEKFNAEIMDLQTKCKRLEGETTHKVKEEEDNEAFVDAKFTEERATLKRSYDKKIEAEQQRQKEMQTKIEKEKESWEKEKKYMAEMHQEQMHKLQEVAENIPRRDFSNELTKESEQKSTEMLQYQEAIDEDTGIERAMLIRNYQEKFEEEKSLSVKLKGENSLMKKKLQALQQKTDTKKTNLTELQNKEKNRRAKIDLLEKDIVSYKRELEKRQETIKEKEKMIFEFTKKNLELEKFKFVLEFKLEDMKKQIEPKENEIRSLQAQLEELKKELNQYRQVGKKLKLAILELQQKQKCSREDLEQQTVESDRAKEIFAEMRISIGKLRRYKGDPKALKAAVIDLYQKQKEDPDGKQSGTPAKTGKPSTSQHGHRHLEALEKSVTTMQRNLTKDLQVLQRDHKRLLREQVTLTQEVNVLRKEYNYYERKIQATKSAKQRGEGPGKGSTESALLGPSSTKESRVSASSLNNDTERETEVWQQIEEQRSEIEKLEEELNRLKPLLDASKNSQEAKLPPISF